MNDMQEIFAKSHERDYAHGFLDSIYIPATGNNRQALSLTNRVIQLQHQHNEELQELQDSAEKMADTIRYAIAEIERASGPLKNLPDSIQQWEETKDRLICKSTAEAKKKVA